MGLYRICTYKSLFYKCLCDMKIAPLRLGKGTIDSEGEEAVISEPLRLLGNRVRG